MKFINNAVAVAVLFTVGLSAFAPLSATAKSATAITTAATPSVKPAPTPVIAAVTVPASHPDYRKIFDEFDARLHFEGLSNVDNSAGKLAWLESYQLCAYTRMFETTSDTRYLDRLVSQFDKVLAKRDDKIGLIDHLTSRAMAGWGSTAYRTGGNSHVFVVHTGMILQGPAKFVRIVNENPSLRARYGGAAKRFEKAIDKSLAQVDSQWHDAPDDEGYYVDPAIDPSGPLPLNQSNSIGLVLIDMNAVTPNSARADKVKRMARYFKRWIHPGKDGTCHWAYWPRLNKDGTGNEDISHAAINVEFAAACAVNGISFTQDDLSRFLATWNRVVVKPDSGFASDVGGGVKSEGYVPQAAGRWLSLALAINDSPGRFRMIESVERAFAGKEITRPSEALGIANLLAASKQPVSAR